MIGSIISMKFFGKKGWKDSLIFWFIYILATIIVSAIIPVIGVVLSAAVFIILAHKWYKFNIGMSIKLFIISFIIDIIILMVLFVFFAVSIAFLIPSIFI
jgi:hypothetical protein